jgi:PAS domain S-box-containing protein
MSHKQGEETAASSQATGTHWDPTTREDRARAILASLHEGLIVVDRDLCIREFNPAAERLTGHKAAERLGRKAEVFSKQDSPIFQVLATGEARYGVETETLDGRVFLANYVPLFEGARLEGAVQTFTDVTEQKRLQRQLTQAKIEVDQAFALTLPNSRVEHKLKHTPEYRDEPDPSSSRIRITEVIPDGCYQHVVNSMKVAADLNHAGAMNIPGISKDILVQAIIFHDLGKSQPVLRVGDWIEPGEVFEPGPRHAARSAEIAQHFYGKSPDMVTLIRYHHHEEPGLPPDFPEHLRPMLRMLRIIDGLSACLTRSEGSYDLRVDLDVVTVNERSSHPGYDREWTVNILTGQTESRPRQSRR